MAVSQSVSIDPPFLLFQKRLMAKDEIKEDRSAIVFKIMLIHAFLFLLPAAAAAAVARLALINR